MDNVKDDIYYIHEILDNIEFIIRHTKEICLLDLQSNELLLDSMMFRMVQISELSQKFTDEFVDKYYVKIPFNQIRGLRNRIVHDYGNVEVDIVFDTIKNDIPDLGKLFEEILKLM